MKSVRTAAITTLGCKTNQFESAAMEEGLRQAGWQIVPFEAGAELVIVNTCSVTAATDSQSRNLIRRAQRLNPGCRVVVTGCYAQIDPQTLAALPGVALVLGNEEKRDLLQLLAAQDGTVQVGDIRQRQEAEVATLASFAERSRAFVQIQNGCDAFCAYCIIPYARGRSRSVPPAQVLEQVRELVRAGYPEIVLTGIHIGGYGTDLSPSLTLTDLLRQLLAQGGLSRLRLGSLEPTEIPDELLDLIAGSDVICPHLHIPLQAGDDAVLTAMRRTYDTDFFRGLLQRIRQRLPGAAIGLDVIVGFPGEDDASFARTRQLLEELPWSHLHVFPYSRRPGTPAASMPDQVPATVSKERAALLRQLAGERLADFARRFIGKCLTVVVEGGEGARRRGISRNYLPVRFAGDKSLIGLEVTVRIDAFADGELQGSLV